MEYWVFQIIVDFPMVVWKFERTLEVIPFMYTYNRAPQGYRRNIFQIRVAPAGSLYIQSYSADIQNDTI